MLRRFENKVVLITGAARGIGRTTAEQFANEGATVVATDLEGEAVAEVVSKIKERGGNAIGATLDVGSRKSWDEVAAKVQSLPGNLDALINNAGIIKPAFLEEVKEEDWQSIQNVNLLGVIHGMQTAIELMKEHGGSIVNVASITSKSASPEMAAYGATKAAVAVLTKSAAKECGEKKYGIRINAILPGFVDTSMVDELLDVLGKDASTYARETVGRIPMRRLARPSEIARPILFLASDDASYINGSELVVDGGFLCG